MRLQRRLHGEVLLLRGKRRDLLRWCSLRAHPLVKRQGSEQTDRQRGRGTSAWSQGTQPTRQHHDHQRIENEQRERGEKDWPTQIKRFAVPVDISACIQRRCV